MSVLSVQIESGGYGQKKVLNDVFFQLERGELVGLIGSNGAGKSTTIQSIIGTIPLLKGEINWAGGAHFAYVPERPDFYDQLSFLEHIEFIGQLNEARVPKWREHVDRLLDELELRHVLKEKPLTFSKGMQQKAILLFAFMQRADVYIIDEPFIGLDPKAMKWLIDYLQLERERGAAILMSTHVLDTAEKICDRFVLISKGEMVASGTMAAIQSMVEKEASLLDCYHLLVETQVSL